MTTAMPHRPATGINRTAPNIREGGTEAKAAIFNTRTHATAAVPMGPVRLSRMISSIRSRLRELKNRRPYRPDHRRATPGCRHQEDYDEDRDGQRWKNPDERGIHPRRKPADAQPHDREERDASLQRLLPPHQPPGTGRTVRKRRAAKKDVT